MRRLWRRFRFWLARLLVPEIRIIVRYGKPVGPRFLAARVFMFRQKIEPEILLDCDRTLATEKKGFVGNIPIAHVHEMLNSPSMTANQPWHDEFPEAKPVDQDIVDEALRGTPFEDQ